jgi:hypothetical protein
VIAKGTVGVVLDPTLELSQRDQAAPAAADHPEVVEHVLLEEVDADAERVGGLRSGEPRHFGLSARVDARGCHGSGFL